MFGAQLSVTISFILCIYVGHKFFWLISPPELPTIDKDIWWGNGEPPARENASINKFEIQVKDEVITDLKTRLKNHRLVAPFMEKSANKYGTNLLFLKDIVDYWANHYNWTERQKYLNKYPQYITNIQGLDIHFIHIKPKYPPKKKVRPVLMLHGFPGSVREFYEAIEILQDDHLNAGLELVVPSIPGYGFSTASVKPGMSLVHVAVILKKLMDRLGHQIFYVQGGDLGALTLQMLSVLYPESILGFHTNFPVVYTTKGYLKYILGALYPLWVVKKEHQDRVYPLFDRGMFVFRESGYMHIQSTKPDSIGPALEDSPAGLAAYFLEKFITGGRFSWIDEFDVASFKNMFPYTHLLDNLMYYWITGSVTTAFRIYYETFGQAFWSESFTIFRIPVKVPTMIFRSKHDLYSADGILNEIYPMLINVTDHDTGHFLAFENPELFSKEIIRAIDTFEDHEHRQDYYKLFRAFPSS